MQHVVLAMCQVAKYQNHVAVLGLKPKNSWHYTLTVAWARTKWACVAQYRGFFLHETIYLPFLDYSVNAKSRRWFLVFNFYLSTYKIGVMLDLETRYFHCCRFIRQSIGRRWRLTLRYNVRKQVRDIDFDSCRIREVGSSKIELFGRLLKRFYWKVSRRENIPSGVLS